MVDAVEAKLAQAISSGVFPAGSLPGEDRLARDFGVSKPTLRSAMSRLISRGMVETSPGRQARISPVGHVMLDVLVSRLVSSPYEEGSRKLLAGLLEIRRYLYATLLSLACHQSKDLQVIEEACFKAECESHGDEDLQSSLRLELEVLAAVEGQVTQGSRGTNVARGGSPAVARQPTIVSLHSRIIKD